MTPPQPGDWRHLAEQASNETDPVRVFELVTEINRILGEREASLHSQPPHKGEPKSYRASA